MTPNLWRRILEPGAPGPRGESVGPSLLPGSRFAPASRSVPRLRRTAARHAPLTDGSLVLLKQTVAVAAALLMALAWACGALHGYGAGVQSIGHADCAVCYSSHLSAVETHGAPAPSQPDLVACAVASTHPDGEPGMALGIHPTRGPPA